MTAFYTYLALALLLVPADVPPCWRPALAPYLQQVAIAGEVLDPRETSYTLRHPGDFAEDLARLRHRVRELATAPPLADCQRWPDRNTITDALAFNRAYHQHLEAVAAVDEVGAALGETDALYQVWDALREAQVPYYYVSPRRQSLALARRLLGDQAYEAGVLPPPVPWWRFRRID
jgi:hypothetical protein